MKNKNLYKLTPQIDKKIKEILETLPALQKTHLGKLLFRTVNRPVDGKDIPEVSRLSIPNFDINKQYDRTTQDPIYVNHYLNLVDAYKKDGERGINEYVEKIQYIDKNMKVGDTGVLNLGK